MLSKSKALLGLQCAKALWLDSHSSDTNKPDTQTASLFERGISVGELARDLFPKGKLVKYRAGRLNKMVEETKTLMTAGADTIYEASFVNSELGTGLFSSIDILKRCENNPNAWHIFEVKGSTQAKQVHVDDLAIQLLTCLPSIDIASVNLVHINNQYVRDGALCLSSLFSIQDFTEQVILRAKQLEREITDFALINQSELPPEIAISTHCSSPYKCRFFANCHQNVPSESVFNLYRLNQVKKYEAYHNGTVTYADAKSHLKLNRIQTVQVETSLSQTVHLNKDKLKGFIAEVQYPISHFDFETFNEAVPRFDNQRPYQQMPFQYSLHIEHENGEIEHREFLADEFADPREDIVHAMLNDLPSTGSIMAYNMSFEISRIKELAESFPEYREALQALIPRFIDLLVPFRSLGYYHPDFNGSFSIKSVLPALFKGDKTLDYKSLDIQNGGMAMDTFAALHRLKNKTQRQNIRQSLLDYCRLDTLAMVKIFQRLQDIAE